MVSDLIDRHFIMKVKILYSLTLTSILTAVVLLNAGCVAAPVVAASIIGAGAATHVAGSGISTGKQIDDQVIKSNINEMLLHIPEQQAVKTNISVTVFNGIVLLLGQVPTEQMKTKLAKKASSIEGVKIVYNQLVVEPKQSLGAYLNDSWITTKVKANMLGDVNPLHFKVVTENRIVYLLGQVTKIEGNKAANVAAHTKGVKQVVKIFNIISAPKVIQTTDIATKQAPQTTRPNQDETATVIQSNGKTTQSDLVGKDQKHDHEFNHDYQVGSNASD